MKNLFYVLVLLFTLNFQSNAQVYDEADGLLNVGVGLGSTLYGTNTKSIIPPLSVSYERGFGLHENVTLGGYVGFNSAKSTYNWFGESYGWNYTTFILGARGSYHFWSNDKWDTYAGALIGYRIVKAKEYGDFFTGTTIITSTFGSGITWSGFLGARYYFKDNMSAFAELGYGISYLTLGISLKM